MRQIPYDREAAVNYAAQYALSYNPGFGSWAQAGGDCANFVSQCLLAGGLPMKRCGKRQWYFDTPGEKYTAATSSWKGAQSLKLYLKYNSEPPYLPITFLPSPQELQQGDILWALNHDGTNGKAGRTAHHVVLVDHVASNGETYIYGHTADKKNERWVYAPEDTLYGQLDDYISIQAQSVTQQSADCIGSRLLRYQSWQKLQNGSDVEWVQSRLKELGYSPGPLDGLYGPLTSEAVKAYQSAQGLQVDGIVGPQTISALQQ